MSASESTNRQYSTQESEIGIEVTIVHEDGSIVVDGFTEIEEMSVNTLRVWWDKGQDEYTEYHAANIVRVERKP